jgi:hypothetical protein
MLTSMISPMSGILIFGCHPTECAKKCVGAKCAPSAKHTASRTSWLHTCRDHKTCQSIFPEN